MKTPFFRTALTVFAILIVLVAEPGLASGPARRVVVPDNPRLAYDLVTNPTARPAIQAHIDTLPPGPQRDRLRGLLSDSLDPARRRELIRQHSAELFGVLHAGNLLSLQHGDSGAQMTGSLFASLRGTDSTVPTANRTVVEQLQRFAEVAPTLDTIRTGLTALRPELGAAFDHFVRTASDNETGTLPMDQIAAYSNFVRMVSDASSTRGATITEPRDPANPSAGNVTRTVRLDAATRASLLKILDHTINHTLGRREQAEDIALIERYVTDRQAATLLEGLEVLVRRHEGHFKDALKDAARAAGIEGPLPDSVTALRDLLQRRLSPEAYRRAVDDAEVVAARRFGEYIDDLIRQGKLDPVTGARLITQCVPNSLKSRVTQTACTRCNFRALTPEATLAGAGLGKALPKQGSALPKTGLPKASHGPDASKAATKGGLGDFR